MAKSWLCEIGEGRQSIGWAMPDAEPVRVAFLAVRKQSRLDAMEFDGNVAGVAQDDSRGPSLLNSASN